MFCTFQSKTANFPKRSVSLSLSPVWSKILKRTQNRIYIWQQKKDSLQQQPETGYDLEFADELSCTSTSNFSWPPPAGDEQRYTPTASPLYIPPPGTQHVQVTKYCDHLCFHLLALSSEFLRTFWRKKTQDKSVKVFRYFVSIFFRKIEPSYFEFTVRLI